MVGPVSHCRDLYIEGYDDEHVIPHLHIRRGFASQALPDSKDVGGSKMCPRPSLLPSLLALESRSDS